MEFGSNQTPVKFYISHFTFDAQTGWYRLAIWEFGSASVLNHPILGIGLTEYARPSWMGSASVDNFWLLIAIRHGIPAVVLMLGSCLWLTGAMAFKKGLDEKEDTFRLSLLISLMALFFCRMHRALPRCDLRMVDVSIGEQCLDIGRKPWREELGGLVSGKLRSKRSRITRTTSASH
ncbi:O-antigen ligase family protein (plasmid) [Sinorhizobium meliloti]|nr:O-antigen ligase family protein [Sinorhizobium meliloti]